MSNSNAMKNMNIMIAGVGGQGTLLASKILGKLAADEGYDVKLSEVHGMAQRGGSVITHVRFGQKVNSPLVKKGSAQIIIAFEQLEALRWCEYLKKEGSLIVNIQKIAPMPVITGQVKYPEGIIEKLRQKVDTVIALDAEKHARECGSLKAANVFMLGVAAKYMDIEKDKWIKVIADVLPAKFVDINAKAFLAGYSLKAVDA